MQVKIYWIDDAAKPASFGIMPRPRGGDWLEEEICSLRSSGVGVIVPLLEREEITELDLKEEEALCAANGIEYLSFPIRDRGVPLSSRDTVSLVRTLIGLLSEGKNLVIHCRQGVGRSALIAALILIMRGVDTGAAFARIASVRGCSVPDTPEQREWVVRLAESIRSNKRPSSKV